MIDNTKIHNKLVDSVYYICLKYGNIPNAATKELISILMKDTDNFEPSYIDNIVDDVVNQDFEETTRSIRRSIITSMNLMSDYIFEYLEYPYEIPEIFFSEWDKNANKILKEFMDYYLGDLKICEQILGINRRLTSV